MKCMTLASQNMAVDDRTSYTNFRRAWGSRRIFTKLVLFQRTHCCSIGNMSASQIFSESPNDPVQGLASCIRQVRRDRGISLRQLQVTSGISFSWLSKLESGHVHDLPKATTLLALARALDTTVSELLIRSGVSLDLVLPADKLIAELRSTAI
jgi:DNA-binding Xre family transcriptional regulator